MIKIKLARHLSIIQYLDQTIKDHDISLKTLSKYKTTETIQNFQY